MSVYFLTAEQKMMFDRAEYDRMMGRVAYFLGYGPCPWSFDQWVTIKHCILEGQRQFEHPEPVSE